MRSGSVGNPVGSRLVQRVATGGMLEIHPARKALAREAE
jgi:hypothetical protein